LSDKQPTFSLCHATARVPDEWRKAATAWCESCDKPHDTEYILCIDLNDLIAQNNNFNTDIPPLYAAKLEINFKRQNAVDAWNCAAAASTGKFIIQVADDLYPPPHWDTELLKVIPGLDGEYVVEVRTGTSLDDEWRRCMAHSFLTRKYYERYGYLFHPDYEGMYADDEFTEKARRDGVVVDARHLLFEHRHWIGTTVPFDDIYKRQNSQERYDRGLEILGRRRAQGFPK